MVAPPSDLLNRSIPHDRCCAESLIRIRSLPLTAQELRESASIRLGIPFSKLMREGTTRAQGNSACRRTSTYRTPSQPPRLLPHRNATPSFMCEFQWKRGTPVGHIVETNRIRFHTAQDGMASTIERLFAHVAMGGPMLDEQGCYVESVRQSDSLKALETKSLRQKRTGTV